MTADLVDWGHLPTEWRIQPLGTLNARRPRTINPASFPDEMFEYYSIPAYQDGQRPVLAKGSEIGSSKLLLDYGTVLFGKLNPRVEKVWRVGNFTSHRKIGSTEWLPIVPCEDIDEQFLYFLMLSDYVMPKAKGLVSGSTPSRQRVDPGSFYRIQAPIPPLNEQRKIGGVLSLVQRAIKFQDRLLALTAELKQAMLNELLKSGLRGQPQKETDVGPIPESWEVVPVSQLVSIKNGQVDPRKSPFKDMLHVGPENIEQGTGRLLNLQTNDELRISSGNYHFTAEDVLYSKIRPYLTKAALPDFEGTCSADMYPLRPKSQELSRVFLFQLLLSDLFKKQAISFQDRTGIPKVNRAQLGAILIAKPMLTEQVEIGEGLLVIDQRVQTLHRKQALLTDAFDNLLHQLMTAQIRVDTLDLSELQIMAVG